MDLIAVIKKSVNARRIFGRREIVIIEKQLLGVPLKASEKTRLSRDIRKKFEAIKELSQFSSEFNLKHSAKIKQIIEETKEIILESQYSPRIKKIMLFGSVVKKELTFRSDIDLAVEFFKINEKESFNFRREVLGKTNQRADIQVYNTLPDKIKREIEKEGRIIYERKSQ